MSRPSLCQLIKLQSALTLDATALLPLRFSFAPIDAMRPSVSNPDLVNLGIEFFFSFFFLINLFYYTISFLFFYVNRIHRVFVSFFFFSRYNFLHNSISFPFSTIPFVDRATRGKVFGIQIRFQRAFHKGGTKRNY